MNNDIDNARDAIQQALGSAVDEVALTKAYAALLTEMDYQLEICMKTFTEKEAE